MKIVLGFALGLKEKGRNRPKQMFVMLLPITQSVKYSTSLFLNFISCLKLRSSRRFIMVSTNWHSLVLMCKVITVVSKWRTQRTMANIICSAKNSMSNTLGPHTTLLLGHQKCSVVQKSAIQGYCYVVIVLYKKSALCKDNTIQYVS